MNNIDLTMLTRHLALVTQDAAMLNAFRLKNPEFVALCEVIGAKPEPVTTRPLGFPAISEMTAIQATIFDNWPQGRRVDRQPNRYGFTFEIWTAPADQITPKKLNHQHKASAVLMDKKAAIAWINARVKENPKKKPDYRLTDSFLNGLVDLADGMVADEYIGLFATKPKTGGTYFFDRQVVFVRLNGRRSEATLIVDDTPVHMPTFSPTDPDDKALKANAWLQSRADLCGFSTAWATPDHDGEHHAITA